MKRITTFALITFLSACTSQIVEEDPIDEPALTAEELALLPDGNADHEHDEATQHPGPAEDDGAVFDDDQPLPFTDVQVWDDEPGKPTPVAFAALLAWGLHPRASDGLRAAGVAAWRITQTI